MPWQSEAMKDVKDCDKPGEASISFDPGISEWGNPILYGLSVPEYIGCRGKRGEVKHLSTRRKRKQQRFP